MQAAGENKREHTMKTRAILLSCVSMMMPLTAAYAQPAPAQPVPAPSVPDAADAASVPGEIIVTARSKAESVQDVPLSITAYTADDLKRRGFQDLKDIGQFTPGFTFENYGGGFGTPVVRGTQQQSSGLEGNVSPFYDGLYLPRGYLTDLGFASLERIEIVKGPQSARYGRNAFMGVINYIPRRPTEDLRADVELTAGIYDRYDASVSVSGPLVKDNVLVVAGFDASTFDGSWVNPHPFDDIKFKKGTNGRIGGWYKLSYNVGVRLLPSTNFVVDASYRHFDIREEETALNFFGELNANSQILNCGVSNRTVRPTSGDWKRLYCGTLPANVLAQDPRSYGRQLKTDLFRANISWDISDAFNLNYLGGLINAKTDALDYKDVLPGCTFFISGQCIFENGPIGNVKVSSHEFRLSYDNKGPFTFATGGYVTHEADNTISTVTSLPVLTSVPTAPVTRSSFILFIPQGDTYTTSLIHSVFGEVGLSLLDKKLRFGVEARYSEQKKTALNRLTALSFSDTFKSFTPRFTAEYNFTDDHKLFASAARGVKTGGFNSNAFLPENRTFGQESNWTYELGTRNRFLGGRALLNATAFYINWNAVQIPAQNIGSPNPLATSIVLNLGKITSKGIELDGSFRASRNFSVYGTLAYTDARYADGTIDRRWGRTPAVCDNIVCKTNGDIGGNTNQNSPRWQGSLGGEFSGDLSSSRDLGYYVRADLGYKGGAPADAVNLALVAPRTVVNSSIGLTSGKFEARLWVKNLFDKQYVANAFVGQPNSQYVSHLGDRRTAGLTLRASY
jgi:iron complex outermembrane recepter protein